MGTTGTEGPNEWKQKCSSLKAILPKHGTLFNWQLPFQVLTCQNRIMRKVASPILLLTAVISIGQSAEIQINESGNVEDTSGSNFGYKFGPSTSKATIKPKPWSILEELFPDAPESLAENWGKHPVYLPISDHGFDAPSSLRRLAPNVDKKTNRFSHLMKADDSLTVLQTNPNFVHGTDYIVLKYLLKDGEEWNGQLPYKSIPAQDIALLLNNKAFSLVINNIDRHWAPVQDAARSLETETLVNTACNLYLTPPRKARAFESHMDWMDVIVLQLEGEKLWSVSPEPMIQLVLPDQKRKPTKEELKLTPFEDILLRPGDALYIPRGHLHNATTTSEGARHSLHLTFGIHYGYETTFEALLHYALHIYKDEHDNKYIRDAAVSRSSCVHRGKLTWVKLLHYSMSELARRTDCGGYGEYGKKSNDNDDNFICSMRESVPLHPQFQALREQADDDVEKKFQRILHAVQNQVNAADAFNFMNSLTQKKQGVLELGSSSFRYVGMEDNEPFNCKPLSRQSDISQDTLVSLAQDFTSFAKGKFHDVRRRLIDDNENERIARWRQRDGMK